MDELGCRVFNARWRKADEKPPFASEKLSSFVSFSAVECSTFASEWTKQADESLATRQLLLNFRKGGTVEGYVETVFEIYNVF